MKILNKKTLIVIPIYNEEKNIGSVLDLLSNKRDNANILVINDGSTDNSKNEIEKREVLLISHPFNLGIGASFQTGCQFALENNYDFLVRVDGDGQHNSLFIKDILEPVKKGEFDIVIGSRFLGRSEFKSSFLRIIGIKIISLILFFLTGKKATDPTSGFCAMNKIAFSFFAMHCAEDYPEPEILLHHRNFRITEIPITLMKRLEGSSSITPLKSLYYMYKVLFSIFVSIFRRG